MRGNEAMLADENEWSVKFPIPMRGNEFCV